MDDRYQITLAVALLVVSLIVLGGFWHTDAAPSDEAKIPGAGQPSILRRYDFAASPERVVELSKGLREVSGAALFEGARLLVHNDEKGIVYEILPDAEVDVLFHQRSDYLAGDYEAIAVANELVYLLASDGQMLVLGLPRIKKLDIPLGEHCELEGLDYSSKLNRLIYACKKVYDESAIIRLYQSDLELTEFELLFELGSDRLPATLHDFAPSAIVTEESIILASARQEALLELNWQGDVVYYVKLKKKRHPQTEGLELLPDGTLIVLDEGKKRGRLQQYAPLN